MITLEHMISWTWFFLLVSLALAMQVISIVIKKPKVLMWSVIFSIILSGMFCAIHFLQTLTIPNYDTFIVMAQFGVMIMSVFLGLFVFIAMMSIRFAIISLKSKLKKTLKIVTFSFLLCMFIVSAGITLNTVIWSFSWHFKDDTYSHAEKLEPPIEQVAPELPKQYEEVEKLHKKANLPGEAVGFSKFESNQSWVHYARIHEEPSYEITLPDRNLFYPMPIFAFSQDRQRGLYAYIEKPEGSKTSMIWLINLQDGDTFNSFVGHPGSTQCLAFSPDGKRSVSGGSEGILRLWDTANGKEINNAKGHKDYIRAVAYSPVEDMALTGGDDRDILLWDIKKMMVQKKFIGHTSGIRHACLEWSKDGKIFLSGSWDGSIRLWDIQTGKELAHLQAGYGEVMSLSLSPDSNFALSSYLSGPNQPVIYWDLKQKKEINRFGIVGNPWFAHKALHVQSVTFSPDGKTALFGLEFGTVIWWSLDDWKEIAQNRVYEKELAYVTFSADGDYCISVGYDKSTTNKKPDAKIRFWKLPNQKSIEVN